MFPSEGRKYLQAEWYILQSSVVFNDIEPSGELLDSRLYQSISSPTPKASSLVLTAPWVRIMWFQTTGLFIIPLWLIGFLKTMKVTLKSKFIFARQSSWGLAMLNSHLEHSGEPRCFSSELAVQKKRTGSTVPARCMLKRQAELPTTNVRASNKHCLIMLKCYFKNCCFFQGCTTEKKISTEFKIGR